MTLRHFLKSFFFFLSSFFKKREYDVLFYYPAHFNRGEGDINPFFEPLYGICRKHNISYLVIEEPELFKKTKRNAKAVPFDFMLIAILVLRKIIPLKRFASFQHREWLIAGILKPIFFRKFFFQNYIVLSNSMMGFFRGLNQDATLYDYQHGVITSQHRGYIDAGMHAAEHIRRNEANVLVYGKGFADVLTHGTVDGYYDSHVYVAGQSIKGNFSSHYGKRSILFSLQFADPNPELNQKILERIVNFFTNQKDFFINNDITVLFKHHPRFQYDIDPSPLYAFAFTKLYEGNLFDGLSESFLHMTFNSTVTFEAASMGIPTLLMKNDLLDPQFFVDDYNYPLGIMDESEIVEHIQKYIDDEADYLNSAKKVFEWYGRFYSEIDEKLFVELMKGTK